MVPKDQDEEEYSSEEASSSERITVRTGEYIDWLDKQSTLVNLKDNLSMYLTYTEEKGRAVTPYRKKIAGNLLERVKELLDILEKNDNDNDKQSPQFIVKYIALVDYLKKNKVDEKGAFGKKSFLAALIKIAKPRLEEEMKDLNMNWLDANDQLKTKNEELARQVKELQRQLKDKGAQESDLAAKLKEKTDAEAASVAEVGKLKEIHRNQAQALQRKEDQSSELDRVRKERDGFMERGKELLAENKGLEQEVERLQAEKTGLEATKTKFFEETGKLGEREKRMKAEHAGVVKGLREAVEKVSGEKQKLEKDVSRWKGAFEGLLNAFNGFLKLVGLPIIEAKTAGLIATEAQGRLEEARSKLPEKPAQQKGPGSGFWS